MTRPDRWFDTSGMHPYERTAQEMRELYGGFLECPWTRVVYEEGPIGFTIHVGTTSRPWVLTELRDKIERELQRGTPMHASAPTGMSCADCSIDGEACPDCYTAWWVKNHSNVQPMCSICRRRHGLEVIHPCE